MGINFKDSSVNLFEMMLLKNLFNSLIDSNYEALRRKDMRCYSLPELVSKSQFAFTNILIFIRTNSIYSNLKN